MAVTEAALAQFRHQDGDQADTCPAPSPCPVGGCGGASPLSAVTHLHPRHMVKPASQVGVPALDGAVVTGVAGFIGSHLAEALVRGGVAVIGVDNRSPGQDSQAKENLAGLLGAPGFRFVHADLRTCPLRPLVDKASVVFHLAAVPGVRDSWGRRFCDYLTCNILTTQRLLEACSAACVPRLLVASSSSVYGHTMGRPSREEDPTRPVSPYGVTKLAAECLSLAYGNRFAAAAVSSAVASPCVVSPTCPSGTRPQPMHCWGARRVTVRFFSVRALNTQPVFTLGPERGRCQPGAHDAHTR